MKNTVIIISVLVIAILGGVLYANRDSGESTAEDETTSRTVVPNPEVSDSFKEDDQNNPNPENPEESPETPETSYVTSVEQDEDGNMIVVTNVGSLSSGTCELTVTGNGETITQTAAVIFAPAFSACAGFEVKAGELSPGEYSVKLSVVGGGSTYESETIKVEIE